MSVLTSVGIILFSLLIVAFLQLVPGIFLLFSHYATGKFSKPKADDLIVFFTLGVEVATTIMFMCAYSVLAISPISVLITENQIFTWIMAGIFISLSFAMLVFYYRKGSGSRLFISRHFATGIHHRIAQVRRRSDAFLLGFFSIVPELIFTLPLYCISTLVILESNLNVPESAGIIILFALAAIFPLIITRVLTQLHNYAFLIKLRFRYKSFFRFWLALCFFMLAVLIIIGVLL